MQQPAPFWLEPTAVSAGAPTATMSAPIATAAEAAASAAAAEAEATSASAFAGDWNQKGGYKPSQANGQAGKQAGKRSHTRKQMCVCVFRARFGLLL